MSEPHAMKAMAVTLTLMLTGVVAFPFVDLRAAPALTLPRFPAYRVFSFVEPADFSAIQMQLEGCAGEPAPWLAGAVEKITFTPDNSHVVVAGRVAAIGTADQTQSRIDVIHTCPIDRRYSGRWFAAYDQGAPENSRRTSLAVHPDGSKLLCRLGHGNTRLHALPGLEVQGEYDVSSADFHPHQPWIMGLQGPNGRLLALTHTGEVADGFKIYPYARLPLKAGSIHFETGRVALSRDGRWSAGSCRGPTGFMRRHLAVASTAPGHPCVTLPADDFEAALKVFFTPNNERLIALCRPEDRSTASFVRAWNLVDRSVAWTTQLPSSVRRIALSPDGRWFAAACKDHSIRMVSALTGEEFASLKGQVNPIRALAFSSDGRLFGAAEGNAIYVWSVVY